MSGQGSGGNVIAALCNFFIPGLGQLIQGRILAALIFFILCAVNYSLMATGILFFMGAFGFIFQVWSIVDAARYKGS